LGPAIFIARPRCGRHYVYTIVHAIESKQLYETRKLAVMVIESVGIAGNKELNQIFHAVE
jgi:hypothetical protein